MDADAAVQLLKDVGISRIIDFDGCLCGSCEIKGVYIGASCRKASGSDGYEGLLIRVYSQHMDVTPDGLRIVAEEAARQFRGLDSWTKISVRYCDFCTDRDRKCVYCGKRRRAKAYLCDSCQSGNDAWGDPIAPRRDYRLVEFTVPQPGAAMISTETLTC